MCEFENDRTATICDVAIGAVRERLTPVFGAAVSFTHVHGQPTRVVASARVPQAEFRALTEAAITAAQLENPG